MTDSLPATSSSSPLSKDPAHREQRPRGRSRASGRATPADGQRGCQQPLGEDAADSSLSPELCHLIDWSAERAAKDYVLGAGLISHEEEGAQESMGVGR